MIITFLISAGISVIVSLYYSKIEQYHFIGGLPGAILIGLIGGIIGMYCLDFLSSIIEEVNILALIIGTVIVLRLFAVVSPFYKK